ncbi:MAG: M18 family aminopeptidase [Propionibacteriaceae bacterium]
MGAMASKNDLISDYTDFIKASPSSYHAAAQIAARLDQAGYVREDETAAFSNNVGGHYIVRDGAVIAWQLPQGTLTKRGFRIVGSHTDSPSFKLKPNPVHQSAGWQQLGMEIYGGPLLNSWLNRDLGLAGRLISKTGEVKLVATDAIMVIPQLAPHLDRSVNDDLKLDRQAHLMPTYAAGKSDLDALTMVCELAGMKRADLGFYDLHATDTQEPQVIGADKDFFAAWRQDNLSSVFASLAALLSSDDADDIMVLAAFDHEEVGSATRTGACGPFLEDVLRGVVASIGGDSEDYRQMLNRSSCVSADAGHAVNPNYVGKHDPDNHPQFNQGPVLKINGNQRYATDGVGGALWLRVCEAAGVPSQAFVGNNGVPCGSTIGPLTATRLGILTIDVGIPLLSMHSARELSGVADIGYMAEALRSYLSGA